MAPQFLRSRVIGSPALAAADVRNATRGAVRTGTICAASTGSLRTPRSAAAEANRLRAEDLIPGFFRSVAGKKSDLADAWTGRQGEVPVVSSGVVATLFGQ